MRTDLGWPYINPDPKSLQLTVNEFMPLWTNTIIGLIIFTLIVLGIFYIYTKPTPKTNIYFLVISVFIIMMSFIIPAFLFYLNSDSKLSLYYRLIIGTKPGIYGIFNEIFIYISSIIFYKFIGNTPLHTKIRATKGYPFKLPSIFPQKRTSKLSEYKKDGSTKVQKNQYLVVGVGGTGAKIIESISQLAPSSNIPNNIKCILIDQDSKNGNVKRCINSLNTYKLIRDKISMNNNRFFQPEIVFDNEDIPLVPIKEEKTFNSVIEYDNMETVKKDVIDALYSERQKHDSLGNGFKRRSNMGSVVITKFLNQIKKHGLQGSGFNRILNKFNQSSSEKSIISICGSLFGGTGASGFIPLSKFFREQYSDATIRGIIFLPYYSIPNCCNENEDEPNLAISQPDLSAVKFALDIYYSEIDKAFDEVYLIGTNNSSDPVSDFAHSGGIDQLNPANFLEIIAATACFKEPVNDRQDKYFAYTIPDEQNLSLSLKNFQNIDREAFLISYYFASLIIQTEGQEHKDWLEYQPWYNSKLPYSELKTWARMHKEWVEETCGKIDEEKNVDQPSSSKDPMILGFDNYKFNSYMSIYLPRPYLTEFYELIYSIGVIYNKKKYKLKDK